NNTEVKEIFGEGMVKGVKLLNNKTNEESELKLDGLFVEIGSVPNSHIVKGLVNINERGEIITNSDDQSTSCEGIWAAGDVDNGRFKQNNVAVGDAIKALLSLYSYLNKQK
ncbi:FAD-dependent oxidoreductase, partial [Candidatus Wolfebacteria bacterium]|nr:FAD-dependent oxidoreductase [Candidatus Wolfebacteria bacterium]